MKVDRKKFEEAMNYLWKIETFKLEDLDLSEFFEANQKFPIYDDYINDVSQIKWLTYDEIVSKHNFIGLNNRDFILMWKK